MSTAYRLPDGTVPVLVSAATPALLRAELTALLDYASAHPEVSPDAFCAMLFRTRSIRRNRVAALVRDRAGLLDVWQAVLEGRDHPAALADVAGQGRLGRVGLVFPGQGGHRPGMGRLFYESAPAYRAEADRCAAAFAESGAAPLGYLLDPDCRDTGRAGLVQPALFVQTAALAALWRSFGVEPAAVIGHSQGEIAAAYVAGAITLDDAARAVTVRAAAVDGAAADGFAMGLAALDVPACEAALARQPGWAEVSVVNSPGMTGFSGDRDTVQAVVDSLTGDGVFARLLRVGYPAHTSWIDRLRDRVLGLLSATLHQSRFADTGVGWFGGTLGGRIDPQLPVADYWFANLRNTVRFDRAVQAAAAEVSTLVELAEHPTLQLAIEENLTEFEGRTVVGTSNRSATDLTEFSRSLMRVALRDPAYRWDVLRTESGGTVALPLPDFPNSAMSAVPLWLPYDSGRPAPPAAPSTPASIPVGIPQLLVERWDRLTRRSMTPPRSFGVLDYTGSCAELTDALCTAAADLGGAAEVIGPDSATTDFTALVVLVPATAGLDTAAAAARVGAFFTDRPWTAGLTATVTDCTLVTVGGEPVDGSVPDPVAAGIAAGFRSVGAEHPGVTFAHLDLPTGPADPAAVIAALHIAGEPELALRGGALYAKRIAPQPAAPQTHCAPPEHVLILGGTGNLGLEFTDHFARLGAQRITVVSRSGAAGDTAQRIERIRAESTAVIDVRRCDITDPAAVTQLAGHCADTPADLIVHAAMAYRDLDSGAITAADADASLQAKVVGLQRILDAFPRAADCRILLCSSAAATIGGRGQVLYAAANRMLDALADQHRADGIDCVSVQWGQWTTLDLTAAGWAKLTATGLLPMRPADALAVGLNGLRHNTAVAAFDLELARTVLGGYGYRPLLSELTAPPVVCDPAGTAGGPAAARMAPADAGQWLLGLLATAIGVDGPEAIDVDAPMVAIGLDSLQALEFRRRVKAELDHDLDVADLLGGASVADVLTKLTAAHGNR